MNFEFMTIETPLPPCMPFPRALTGFPVSSTAVSYTHLDVDKRQIDECANIGQIPKLEKLVATSRSREISACLVLQAQSQLKAIYKDNADTIIGNMDTSIFLMARITLRRLMSQSFHKSN